MVRAEYVIKLAKALYCEPEELLERVSSIKKSSLYFPRCSMYAIAPQYLFGVTE